MAHDHGHAGGVGNRVRLMIVIGIVAVVLIIEIVGAALSGSIALLADAGHMGSDLLALIVALVATIVASRPATDRQTFGFQRAEVFGALINGVLLIAVAVWVLVEAVLRFTSGEAEVVPLPMLIAASIGLIANIASMLLLRDAASQSINMRGAYLEVLGDLLGSIAVIIAAIITLLTGFARADTIASLVIVALIVPRAFSLLRDVVHVLSEAAPADTDVAQIREHIRETAGVVDVHDVHVWSITSGAKVFSAHVVVAPEVFADGEAGALLDKLGECLTDHFDVAHSTFQLEPVEHAAHEDTPHR